MLRFEKLTVKAQEALGTAQEIAARHENQEVAPLHLLAALANAGGRRSASVAGATRRAQRSADCGY